MKAVDETLPTIYESAAYKADNPSQDRLVVKNGAHFLITDENGMMPLSNGAPAPFGLFRDDTRYLSGWQILFNGVHPRLLASDTGTGFACQFVYGNPTLKDLSSMSVPEQSVLLTRNIVVGDRTCEKLVVTNYHIAPVDIEVAIVLDADFADMFEVRGSVRPKRGSLRPVKVTDLRGARSGKRMNFVYDGLDGSVMRTTVMFYDGGCGVRIIDNKVAVFRLRIEPRQSHTIETAVVTNARAKFEGAAFKNAANKAATFDFVQAKALAGYNRWRSQIAGITTGNTTVNQILDRAYRDIFILRQPTPKGVCIAAGTPWFACAFGRDQIVTALEILYIAPQLARDVILVLAHFQGTKHDEYTEERPGKIMHELRLGEMARCGEIPFKPYYGTIDATPLWLMLLARYVEATGDVALAEELWDNVEAALNHLDGEMRVSGYLTYGGRAGAALSNQGWKDSGDSVMYSDGTLAVAPIALCEPQGYLYDAWIRLSAVARRIRREDMAASLTTKARALKIRFNNDFWMPAKQFVALALDSEGEQCDVVSSNPGHLLSTGILDDARAHLVAERLMSREMFCGWGIRTLAEGEAAYNPMSYHNGSVWPHDNALAVEGLASLGRAFDAHRVLHGMTMAAGHQPDRRLPELFCGFANPQTQPPIRYPVSCVPQAWAAGTMLHMLVSCLGIETQGNKLFITKPSIPVWLNGLTVTGLLVGKSRVDLRFDTGADGKTSVTVTDNADGVVIEIE